MKRCKIGYRKEILYARLGKEVAVVVKTSFHVLVKWIKSYVDFDKITMPIQRSKSRLSRFFDVPAVQQTMRNIVDYYKYFDNLVRRTLTAQKAKEIKF